MPLMSPIDAGFLLIETRTQPMHVGGLQVFKLPSGAKREWLKDLYDEVIASTDVDRLFRQRPHRSVATGGAYTWALDADVDLEHHVRHSALARPGRVRELLALTSRLHGTPLDRHRPLWEVHLIEGLQNRRFAVYTKVHHALVDGVSALRLLEGTLSDDPDDRQTRLPWATRPRRSRPGGSGGGVATLPQNLLRNARDVLELGPGLARIAGRSLTDDRTKRTGIAPRTILNVPITGSRRYAAQGWPLDTIRRVAKAADATVNDVVLAMCGGALREYLRSLGALPEAPLVAMTPVSMRGADASESTGNAVGAIRCDLATNVTDPIERLATIKASIGLGKAALAHSTQLQATALSAMVMLPLAASSVGVLRSLAPPPFNIIISNVPGPTNPLYLRGAELEGLYPLSIPFNGQALNITVTSYNGSLDFGLTGCRKSVPHLQRLLSYLDDALGEMVAAFDL
ncbi:MAG: wax ester/triacylglycerol synthase family O-acyltransferase [Actinomycetota bacterium]|nr:wax ester/triacylglycerol synthase family O-acyltransferase [Actinomycetota bacterium]